MGGHVSPREIAEIICRVGGGGESAEKRGDQPMHGMHGAAEVEGAPVCRRGDEKSMKES
jgi:hypothetical protein